MTLDQLRIFVAAAERGHLTQAAQALGLTQSAASAAVAALEARHDVKLFHRVGRGIELSDAGRNFLPSAKQALESAARAQRALDDLAGLKGGEIRIFASQTLANAWAPPRLAAFAQAYRDIRISVTATNTDGVARAVRDGEADFGLVEGEVPSESLIKFRLGGDRLSLYASAEHPLARRARLEAADVVRARYILREAGSGTRAEFESVMAKLGVAETDLDVLLTLPSTEAVLAALDGANALAPASDLAAAPFTAMGRIVRLPFDLSERHFTLLQHPDRPPGAAARKLIDDYFQPQRLFQT